MKPQSAAKAFLLSASLLAASAPALAEFDLTGQPYILYGDGQSYSLPITQFLNGCEGPGCDFYVNSTPGAIKDLIVVATGSSGAPVTTNIDGIEDAYATPNGKNGANFYETSNTANDPGFSNAVPTTQLDWAWDAEVSALNDFRNGEDLVFFFNNNQINSCDSACQALAFWAQLWITNEKGELVGQVYEFVNQFPDNESQAYEIVSTGLSGGILNGDPTLFNSALSTPPADEGTPDEPHAGDNGETDYVLSGGQICLTMIGVPVPCDDPLAATGAFNHNLGANEAAYAIIFAELNALIDTLGSGEGYTLHIDFNMGCDPASGAGGSGVDDLICTGADGGDAGRNLNNGFEQIFIGTAKSLTNVPVPATVFLLGIGVLGLGLMRRRAAA